MAKIALEAAQTAPRRRKYTKYTRTHLKIRNLRFFILWLVLVGLLVWALVRIHAYFDGCLRKLESIQYTYVADDMAKIFTEKRFDELVASGLFRDLPRQLRQLGTYGGGNHFGECEDVQLCEEDSDSEQTSHIAEVFGLRPGCAAFLSHCGSLPGSVCPF